MYHETFRTKAVIIPKLNKHGALVHFRGFQGEYTVTALLEDGSTKQLPNYKLEWKRKIVSHHTGGFEPNSLFIQSEKINPFCT